MSFAFRRGVDAIKDNRAQGGGGGMRYMILNDGDMVPVRFLTDHLDWIEVLTHASTPTRPKPDEWPFDKWPKAMTAIDRTDPAWVTEDGPLWEEDWISENVISTAPWSKGEKVKSRSQGWALAVERELVYDDDRTLIGIRDKVDDNGRITILKIVQSYENFWSKLRGHAKMMGTVANRDVVIRREGSKKKTDYEITMLDPIPVGKDLREELDLPEDTIFDMRNEKIAKHYLGKVEEQYRTAGNFDGMSMDAEDFGTVLMNVLIEMVSQPYIDRWFVPGAPLHLSDAEKERAASSDDDEGSSEGTSTKAETPEQTEALAALGDKLKGYGKPADDGEKAKAGGLQSL